MRAAVLCLCLLAPLAASAKPPPIMHAGPSSQPGPPHAWLFGVWTGGLFPVLDGMAGQDCKSQPTVVFMKDEVAHATLLGTEMAHRTVETVRGTPTGVEFRFAPVADPAGSFGCENPDELHIARAGENEISFPHCAAFPYTLQRCPAR